MENTTKKFRVWDKLNKYFTYVRLGIDECPIGEQYVYQQDIGRLDLEGKNLYEGDIIQWYDYFYEIVQKNKLGQDFFVSFSSRKKKSKNTLIFEKNHFLPPFSYNCH